MVRAGLREMLLERQAQSTVEYAITVVAVLSMVVGFAAIWRAGVDGTLARIAREALSHTFDAAGAIDIALY